MKKYEKTIWVDGKTKICASRLNKIEDGIEDLSELSLAASDIIGGDGINLAITESGKLRISSSSKISASFVIVEELPEKGDSDKIYLKKKESTDTFYTEYLWTVDGWSEIGTTEISISGYATTNYVDSQDAVIDAKIDSSVLDLEGKISEKADSIHTHTIAQVSGLQSELSLLSSGMIGLDNKIDSSVSELEDKINEKADLVHSHEISGISGLQDILNRKSGITHVHSLGGVTGLQNALDSKAELVHSHEISDIDDLQYELDRKQVSLVSGVNIKTIDNQSLLGSGNIEVGTKDYEALQNRPQISGIVLSGNKSLDDLGIAAKSHVHNIGGVTGLQEALNGKAGISHNHPINEVIGLSDSLDEKADLIHTHTIAQVSGLQEEIDLCAKNSVINPELLSIKSRLNDLESIVPEVITDIPSTPIEIRSSNKLVLIKSDKDFSIKLVGVNSRQGEIKVIVRNLKSEAINLNITSDKEIWKQTSDDIEIGAEKCCKLECIYSSDFGGWIISEENGIQKQDATE